MIDLKALSAPFPPERISWRAQTVSNGKALALAYIDARDVQDRLDEVCGPENWQNRYTHTQGKTVCEIGIKLSEWIWKADGAGDSDIEAEKGALSDAFKRAAVKWGIGRYLYDLESPWVPCEVAQNGKFRRFTDDPWKYVRNAPKAASPPAPKTPPKQEQPYTNGSTYHLVDPHDPKSSKACARGSMFLDDLEHMMAQGNAADWWAVNGSTAKHIAEKYPQAAKRVAQLEAMASGGYLAAG